MDQFEYLSVSISIIVCHCFFLTYFFTSILLDNDGMKFSAMKYLNELGIAVPVAFGFLIAETLFLAMCVYFLKIW